MKILENMRVGILEDLKPQAQLVAGWLNKAGFATEVRHDGDSFIELVRTHRVDLMLLDWNVPGKSGIDVLQWLRTTFAHRFPIIMLTQQDSEHAMVYALDCGADDYLTKPLRERELLARVRAQMRKYYPAAPGTRTLELGRFSLDTESCIVHVNGNPVGLSTREFAVALALFSNLGRIVSKDLLQKSIWGVVDRKFDATLATYMSKLRSRLGLRAANGVVVSTIYNYGYRLDLATTGQRDA